MTGLTGEFSGVLDRIVDDETAVVLVENDTLEELTLPVEDLPERTTEGAVVDLVLEDCEVTDISYRADETERRRQKHQDRLDSLSRTLSEE